MTYNLTDEKTVKQILARHGIVLTKARGQNFLINPSVCPRMAQACGATKEDGVLEIGPGVGVLTAELAKVADKVVSVEIDKGLPPVLAETLADFDNVTIIEGDV
jgi:16S rRNA (adenine1518-N6/adenine1519-N6)-dimethyltransferase